MFLNTMSQFVAPLSLIAPLFLIAIKGWSMKLLQRFKNKIKNMNTYMNKDKQTKKKQQPNQ